MAMPIRYCFEGREGLGYSVTAPVVVFTAGAAAPDAVSLDGCTPRPQATATRAHATTTRAAGSATPPHLRKSLFICRSPAVRRTAIRRDPSMPAFPCQVH